MKLNENDLKTRIGDKEYSILRDIFPASLLETDENMIIPYIGKRKNVSMKMLHFGKGFKLSSPIKAQTIDPLYGIKEEKSAAAIVLGEPCSKNAVSIATPDYMAKITDNILEIDGLKVVKKAEDVVIDYNSPQIHGIDDTYNISFHFHTTNGLLSGASFHIQTEQEDTYSVIFTEKSIHTEATASLEKQERFRQILWQVQSLYYDCVQTKESHLFQEMMNIINILMNNKKFGLEWRFYQRDFERRLPELYRIMKEWLEDITRSMEATFYMEHHEIARLIKARTDITKKLSGE